MPTFGPVVHIGFAKAASTFMQSVFADHAGICFCNGVALLKQLCVNELFFDAVKTSELVREERQMAAGRQLVVSHERLSGNPHSGFYDCAEIAERLGAVVPDAKIIIIIREQFSMMVSCYKQYIRIGGTKTLEEYLKPVKDYRSPGFDWKVLRYLELVRLYQQLFGQKNVFVMPVELLAKKSDGSFPELFHFMGLPAPDFKHERINEGIRDTDVEALRRKNFASPVICSLRDPAVLRPSLIAKMLRPIKNEGAPLLEQAEQLIGAERFHESNQALSTLLGIELAELGYS
jgi:hypothetical protein